MCQRQFDCRSACLQHASRHLPCTGNLLLFYADLDDRLAAANQEQLAFESAARKKGVSTAYTGVLSTQAEGPLQRFVVPLGYRSPTNSHKMWKSYNLDPASAFQVDLVHLIALVRAGELDTALEEVPLTLLL